MISFEVQYFVTFYSYDVNFREGPKIHCEPYSVTAAVCEDLELTEVIVPTIWSSPDQSYAQVLLAVVGDLVIWS